MSPSLSVIVPTHRLDATVQACMKALAAAQQVVGFEVIVVLDGVGEEEEAFFSEYAFRDLQVLALPENRGPAYARNRGAEVAQGAILFFVDADVVVPPETLTKVCAHFAQEGAAEALIGSYDDVPAHPGLVSRFRNLLHHYTHQHSAENAQTFWGACGAIQREVFLAVGGFDEAYTEPSVEDIALGYRLVAQGFRIRLQKDLWVKHLKRWTLHSMVTTDIWKRAKPWTLLLLQPSIGLPNDLNLNYRTRISTLVIVLAMVCLSLAWKYPWLWLGDFIGIVAFWVLNVNFYAFLRYHFRWWLLPYVVGLHALYHLSALLGFVLGWITFQFREPSKPTGQV